MRKWIGLGIIAVLVVGGALYWFYGTRGGSTAVHEKIKGNVQAMGATSDRQARFPLAAEIIRIAKDNGLTQEELTEDGASDAQLRQYFTSLPPQAQAQGRVVIKDRCKYTGPTNPQPPAVTPAPASP